jgi:hypothetical protein
MPIVSEDGEEEHKTVTSMKLRQKKAMHMEIAKLRREVADLSSSLKAAGTQSLTFKANASTVSSAWTGFMGDVKNLLNLYPATADRGSGNGSSMHDNGGGADMSVEAGSIFAAFLRAGDAHTILDATCASDTALGFDLDQWSPSEEIATEKEKLLRRVCGGVSTQGEEGEMEEEEGEEEETTGSSASARAAAAEDKELSASLQAHRTTSLALVERLCVAVNTSAPQVAEVVQSSSMLATRTAEAERDFLREKV